ncbi:MAG: hypothetical protein CMN02_11055 [Roseibacillus sp.]|nr:hypothetical protein [Roseibacillus sp.]|tara:strand:- start:401 stop:793 length:393 start_codon:yes stop_codon:yes gene_type:complete
MYLHHRYQTPFNVLSGLHRAFSTSSRDLQHSYPYDGARIVETNSAWVLQTDLPGFSKEDVSLSFQKGTLRLVAERDNPANAFQSRVERSFEVTKELDTEHISATLENGLLEITLPKPTAETNGLIEITVN